MPQRGGWRGNGSSQSSGGRGQGKDRGQDRNRSPVAAADLVAELDKYHAEAVKENKLSDVLFIVGESSVIVSVAF
jgi:THO complex subunit 4